MPSGLPLLRSTSDVYYLFVCFKVFLRSVFELNMQLRLAWDSGSFSLSLSSGGITSMYHQCPVLRSALA